MQKIIKNIIKIAQTLDNKGQVDLSMKIDAVAAGLLQVKTAQYVGTQGYAIRNSRCWKNCYRNKRAQTPNKSAQVIWTECHDEYVNSLNNDGSSWDKYANSEQIVKTASESESNADYHKNFAEKIQVKIANGIDHGSAVFSTLDEEKNQEIQTLITLAGNIYDVLGEIQDDATKNKLASAADNLVKEAAFGDVMDMARGALRGTKDWTASKGTGLKINIVFENMKRNTAGITEQLKNTYIKVEDNIKLLQNIAKSNKESFGEVALTQRVNNMATSLQKVLRPLSEAYHTMSEISHEVMGEVSGGAGKHMGRMDFADPGDDPDKILQQYLYFYKEQNPNTIANMRQQLANDAGFRRAVRNYIRDQKANAGIGY